MKKALFSIGLLAVVACTTVSFQSCNKIKDEIANQIDPFNFTQQSFEITIAPTSGDSVNTGVVNNSINIQQYINDNLPSGVSLGYNMIDEIKLNKIKVEPVSGFDGSNNFTNISDYMVAFNTNIGLNKSLWPVGVVGSVPDEASYQTQPLEFTYAGNVNLKDYFSESGETQTMYYISGALRRPITHEMKVRVTVEYTIVP